VKVKEVFLAPHTSLSSEFCAIDVTFHLSSRVFFRKVNKTQTRRTITDKNFTSSGM